MKKKNGKKVFIGLGVLLVLSFFIVLSQSLAVFTGGFSTKEECSVSVMEEANWDYPYTMRNRCLKPGSTWEMGRGGAVKDKPDPAYWYKKNWDTQVEMSLQYDYCPENPLSYLRMFNDGACKEVISTTDYLTTVEIVEVEKIVEVETLVPVEVEKEVIISNAAGFKTSNNNGLYLFFSIIVNIGLVGFIVYYKKKRK